MESRAQKQTPELAAVIAAVSDRVKKEPFIQSTLAAQAARVIRDHGGDLDSSQALQAFSSLTAAGIRTDIITVEAFFWGFHFVIPEQPLQDWLAAQGTIAGFIAAVGAAAGPAAPFVAIAAAYAAAEAGLMKAVDKGKGVYLSMLWIAPGVFVPTTIV